MPYQPAPPISGSNAQSNSKKAQNPLSQTHQIQVLETTTLKGKKKLTIKERKAASGGSVSRNYEKKKEEKRIEKGVWPEE
jgi:hypothetical protein